MNKIKILIFGAIAAGLFLVVQGIFIPNWSYPMNVEHTTSKMAEYKSFDKDTVQVVFTGTSHVQYGVIPMQLYSERKIRSYNLSESGGHLSAEYYLLKNAFEYQCPQILMLDVSALFFDYYHDANWRYVLDGGFSFGKTKLEAAYEYAQEYVKDQEKSKNKESDASESAAEDPESARFEESTEEMMSGSGSNEEEPRKNTGEWKTQYDRVSALFNAELSALLPLYKYHSRWGALSEYNFRDQSDFPYYGKGYVYSALRSNAWATLEDINTIAEDLSDVEEYPEYRTEGDLTTFVYHENKLYPADPDEEQLKWLYKIHELCNYYGVKLQLIKIPVLANYKYYTSSWTRLRSQSIHRIANEMGVSFCDLLYDYDVGIEPTDFRDEGMHLNYYGAKKVTSFLGNYLQTVCGVKGAVNTDYQTILPAYKKLEIVTQMQSRGSWKNYMKYLKTHLTGRTVFLAMHGVSNAAFTDTELQRLYSIGMMTGNDGRFGENAYIGVIKEGKSIYEAESEYPVEKTLTLEDGTEVTLSSVGVANSSEKKPAATITVNGFDYTSNGWGLNIVVYDNAAHCVVDQLNFYKKSADEDLQCERNTRLLENDIRKYESLLYDQFQKYM